MTQISRPWDGTVTGDAGAYSADAWSEVWQELIGIDADRADAGVARLIQNELFTQAKNPATAQIEVLTGSAMVQGKYYSNDALVSFTITANSSGNPRIDLVVLRADYAAQTVRLAVKDGTPAASPTRPALTQSALTTWEIPLAEIAVANGFATITDSDINDLRLWVNAADSVFINIVNNSGGILTGGEVTVFDSSVDSGVTTSTSEGTDVAGITEGEIASGQPGRIQTSGLALIRVDENVSRGDVLEQSTTAGQAGVNSDGIGWAICLATASAGELVLAYMNKTLADAAIRHLAGLIATNGAALDLLNMPSLSTIVNAVLVMHFEGSDYTTSSGTFVDIDATDLILTITTSGGDVLLWFGGVVSNNVNSPTYFDFFSVTAAARVANSTNGFAGDDPSDNGNQMIAGFAIATGLAAGTHIFRLQWRNAANTSTLRSTTSTSPVNIGAIEL